MPSSFKILFVFVSGFYAIHAIPVVYKGSSPSGDAIVTISSNDPTVVKYFASKYPTKLSNEDTVISRNPGDFVQRRYSIALPGHAAAGTGRSFVTASSLNPFLTPLFFEPLNFEGVGLSNFESMNLFKGVEGFQDPSFGGTGEIKTVAAVNDNGRVYGNVKTVTFNKRPKNY